MNQQISNKTELLTIEEENTTMATKNQKISDEPERLQIIRNIVCQGKPRSGIVAGVQEMDDAAVIRISDTESLVISSDFVRGSGFYLFQLGYLNYFDVGYYLIVANLSDIAAMGARPSGLTTVIRYTEKMTDQEFAQIFEGMQAAAAFYDTPIVGGDIGGHSADVFAATAFGLVKTEDVLLRRGVKDGDLLCVTGTIGFPITALLYFKQAKPQGFSLTLQEEDKILKSWRRPQARINEGLILAKNKLVSACQDISDGLKATIEQMSEASGKTFTIYSSKLPVDATTEKLASFFEVDPVQIAVSASVDFQLLFTIAPQKLPLCTKLFKEIGGTCTVIGEVNHERKNLLVTRNGDTTELPGVAWKQQTGNYLKEIVTDRDKK